jgi:hypothetical protein
VRQRSRSVNKITLRLFELAYVLVRLDHVASIIVNVICVIAPHSYHFVIAVGSRKVVDSLQPRAARSRRVKSANSDKPPP